MAVFEVYESVCGSERVNENGRQSYRAAGGGDSGPAGLNHQLHPEVHRLLLRVFDVWRCGKLFVQDEGLHD